MIDATERQRRWRLALGHPPDPHENDPHPQKSIDEPGDEPNPQNDPPHAPDASQASSRQDRNPQRDRDDRMEQALDSLYGGGTGGAGDRPGFPIDVGAWVAEVRELFPESVALALHKDAFERQQWQELLLEPETIAMLEPDVHLLAAIMSFKDVMDEESREAARQLLARLVEELIRKLATKTVQTIRGARDRRHRNRNPRQGDIDWHKTIAANLSSYTHETQTIILEHLIGYQRGTQRDVELDTITLCVDQSGSMAASAMYAAMFAAVIASLPNVKTRLVLFDTSIADLTDQLTDPVELLWCIHPGGGTDIAKAVQYCRNQMSAPAQEHLILITDLEEGGNGERDLIERLAAMTTEGVNIITLLALSDEGRPHYSHATATKVAALGIPVFSCTPDNFPRMIAAALERQDLRAWAATEGMTTVV
jgi:Mg-chelatase subunit ChlD